MEGSDAAGSDRSRAPRSSKRDRHPGNAESHQHCIVLQPFPGWREPID